MQKWGNSRETSLGYGEDKEREKKLIGILLCRLPHMRVASCKRLKSSRFFQLFSLLFQSQNFKSSLDVNSKHFFLFQITMNITYAYIYDEDKDSLNGNITWKIVNFADSSHWRHAEEDCK